MHTTTDTPRRIHVIAPTRVEANQWRITHGLPPDSVGWISRDIEVLFTPGPLLLVELGYGHHSGNILVDAWSDVIYRAVQYRRARGDIVDVTGQCGLVDEVRAEWGHSRQRQARSDPDLKD